MIFTPIARFATRFVPVNAGLGFIAAGALLYMACQSEEQPPEPICSRDYPSHDTYTYGASNPRDRYIEVSVNGGKNFLNLIKINEPANPSLKLFAQFPDFCASHGSPPAGSISIPAPKTAANQQPILLYPPNLDSRSNIWYHSSGRFPTVDPKTHRSAFVVSCPGLKDKLGFVNKEDYQLNYENWQFIRLNDLGSEKNGILDYLDPTGKLPLDCTAPIQVHENRLASFWIGEVTSDTSLLESDISMGVVYRNLNNSQPLYSIPWSNNFKVLSSLDGIPLLYYPNGITNLGDVTIATLNGLKRNPSGRNHAITAYWIILDNNGKQLTPSAFLRLPFTPSLNATDLIVSKKDQPSESFVTKRIKEIVSLRTNTISVSPLPEGGKQVWAIQNPYIDSFDLINSSDYYSQYGPSTLLFYEWNTTDLNQTFEVKKEIRLPTRETIYYKPIEGTSYIAFAGVTKSESRPYNTESGETKEQIFGVPTIIIVDTKAQEIVLQQELAAPMPVGGENDASERQVSFNASDVVGFSADGHEFYLMNSRFIYNTQEKIYQLTTKEELLQFTFPSLQYPLLECKKPISFNPYVLGLSYLAYSGYESPKYRYLYQAENGIYYSLLPDLHFLKIQYDSSVQEASYEPLPLPDSIRSTPCYDFTPPPPWFGGREASCLWQQGMVEFVGGDKNLLAFEYGKDLYLFKTTP